MAKTNLGRILIISRGEYIREKAYDKLDAVAFEGSSYLCVKPCTGILVSNEEYWMLIAKKGEKGKDGEVRWLNLTVEEKDDILSQIQSEVLGLTTIGGFVVVDDEGRVGLRYDKDGLDAATISPHLINLLNEILDVKVAVDNALTATGMNPVAGGTIYRAIRSATNSILNSDLFSTIVSSEEPGFNLTDSQGYSVLRYGKDGFDVAQISNALKEKLENLLDLKITIDTVLKKDSPNPVANAAVYQAVKSIKDSFIFNNLVMTAEDGFFIVDEEGNVGFEVNNKEIKPSALNFKLID